MVQTATRPDQNILSQGDQLAMRLAEKLRETKLRKDSFPILARLKKLKQFFQIAYNFFEEASKTQIAVPNAAEWLLDNFYVLEQAIRVVEDDLPANYYNRLPKTDDATRIQVVALAINRETPRLDLDQIKYFIQSFQRATPLQVGELWALPLMLRLAVMETLAEGLADITKLSWEAAAAPKVWKEFRSGSETVGANSETKVVHSILNLRLLATVQWKEFFESTSVLEQTLRRDPINIYGNSDFETRNQYRSIVEELARGSAQRRKRDRAGSDPTRGSGREYA